MTPLSKMLLRFGHVHILLVARFRVGRYPNFIEESISVPLRTSVTLLQQSISNEVERRTTKCFSHLESRYG